MGFSSLGPSTRVDIMLHLLVVSSTFYDLVWFLESLESSLEGCRVSRIYGRTTCMDAHMVVSSLATARDFHDNFSHRREFMLTSSQVSAAVKGVVGSDDARWGGTQEELSS